MGSIVYLTNTYGIMLNEVFRSQFLCVTTDFTNENDSLSIWVIEEYLQTVNEIGSVERITTDSNAQSLAQASLQVKNLF